jgi:hypothetical protein
VVERDLAKVEVASSTLVSRSSLKGERKKAKGKTDPVFTFLLLPFAFFSFGGVAKW